jgi:ribosomal protein S10
MTFVTRLRLESGDRAALDDVVGDLKAMFERKGVECKGPHAESPREVTVPQYRRLAPGEEYPAWRYTVYARTMAVHGGDHVAGRLAHMEFPDSVHVAIEVERKGTVGSSGS